MSEEYTSEIIENTRRQMKIIGYENVKEVMLESIILTGSWMKLEDLKEIMPENEYQELLKELETRERKKYSSDKYPKISQEKLGEIVRDEIKRIDFIVTYDDNGEYKIEEFFATDKISKPINVKDIDGVQLARTITKVMQRHLDYGTFHANRYYSAEEIERALKYDIDRIKRQKIVFEQDRDKIETEAGDKRGNKTMLDSAIEATEEITKTSTIKGQAQVIKDTSKGKDGKVQETEIED